MSSTRSIDGVCRNLAAHQTVVRDIENMPAAHASSNSRIFCSN